jgi:hypothetical protein
MRYQLWLYKKFIFNHVNNIPYMVKLVLIDDILQVIALVYIYVKV